MFEQTDTEIEGISEEEFVDQNNSTDKEQDNFADEEGNIPKGAPMKWCMEFVDIFNKYLEIDIEMKNSDGSL